MESVRLFMMSVDVSDLKSPGFDSELSLSLLCSPSCTSASSGSRRPLLPCPPQDLFSWRRASSCRCSAVTSGSISGPRLLYPQRFPGPSAVYQTEHNGSGLAVNRLIYSPGGVTNLTCAVLVLIFSRIFSVTSLAFPGYICTNRSKVSSLSACFRRYRLIGLKPSLDSSATRRYQWKYFTSLFLRSSKVFFSQRFKSLKKEEKSYLKFITVSRDRLQRLTYGCVT